MISSRWPCITSNGHSSCRTRLRAVSLEWKFGMELAVICTKDMVKFPKNGHLDMFHNRHRGFFGDLELYREKWGPSQPLGGSEVKVKSTRQPSLLLVYWFYQNLQPHACIPISIRWGCLRIWGYRGYSGWFNPHAAKNFRWLLVAPHRAADRLGRSQSSSKHRTDDSRRRVWGPPPG